MRIPVIRHIKILVSSTCIIVLNTESLQDLNTCSLDKLGNHTMYKNSVV